MGLVRALHKPYWQLNLSTPVPVSAVIGQYGTRRRCGGDTIPVCRLTAGARDGGTLSRERGKQSMAFELELAQIQFLATAICT